MHMLELSAGAGIRYADIHMGYGDIMAMADAMYGLYKARRDGTDGGTGNYGELCLEWQEIFDMVKHGKVMPGTIKLAMELSQGKGNADEGHVRAGRKDG